MTDCPFCLASGSIRPEMLASDAVCYVIASRDPVLPDAVMIIPFRHVETPFDLTEEKWISTHRLLAWAKAHLDRRGAEGYSVGWNVGEVGGQSVPHAHLHVIARFADEPLAGTGIRHALKQESNRRPSRR